jgi:amino acid permease
LHGSSPGRDGRHLPGGGILQRLRDGEHDFPPFNSRAKSNDAQRFIDPALGFAIGWNYAMQWVVTMPLEVMAAAITLQYWHLPIPAWAAITVFLSVIIVINLCGVRFYGEAEYTFSIIKVTAVIGFM